MKKTLNIIVYILLVVMIIVNVTLITRDLEPDLSLGEMSVKIKSNLLGGPGSKLEQMEQLIQDKFIEDTDAVALEDAAAYAMVDAMGDRWSYYIPAAEYQAHQEQMENAYVGIGITILIQEDGSGILVQQVTKGGPAEEAGILPQDLIVEIAGHSTQGMVTTDARDLVRGEEGTTVDLKVLRGDQELDFTVERRTIETVVAEGWMLDDTTGYIHIYNFDTRCAEESIAAIEMLLDQGAEQLIFDVRFNPGGYAHELVALLDYLLPEGELFRTVDYAGREDVDMSDADYLDIPMAVLVNGDSYSAAEFFAAALRDYDAAFVVGQKTFGKGYFQTTYRLMDGSALNISIGKYFTPKGVSLAGVGITPDIELNVDDEMYWDIYAGTLDPAEDPQIQAAIEGFSR